MINNKSRTANKEHIAGRGSVVRQLRLLISQFRVLRTGTLSEIRPDNMYQPLCLIIKKPCINWKIDDEQNNSLYMGFRFDNDIL